MNATKHSDGRSREDVRRWAAVLARDARADGTFFYAVKTTRVYCRPSCSARRARRENVSFFATAADAEHAGYRACKRCTPQEASPAVRHATRIAALCRWIDAGEYTPTLAELAQRARLSAYHLHRVFKAVTGLTPKAYTAAARAKRLREALQEEGTVTEAMYRAGFNSSGGFYSQSGAALGMTAKRYRARGADTDIRFVIGACTLGSILVAVSGSGVCAIALGDDPERLVRDLAGRFARARLVADDSKFRRLVARVIAYVERPRGELALPLDVRGTAFQHRVWQALRSIPAGSTLTYAELAQRVGAPKAVRAVAAACAANRVALAIPCHRVVSRDGKLSGYRWGVARKRALLEREAKTAASSRNLG